MGLLPAMAGCDCQICRPEPSYDAMDRRLLDNVLKHGWHVTAVGRGDGPGHPSFAYTVGLTHRVNHPELLISGLPISLMGRVLNDVGDRVLEGHRFTSGMAIEGALTHVPLLCEEVEPEALGVTVKFSSWFHRRPVRAIQLVWPDTAGRFAWQPGSPTDLDDLQPPAWRRATARSGAFAVAPTWPLPIPAERSALVCTHVAKEGAAIGFVSRDIGDGCAEDWLFHCGKPHVWTPENLVAWHVSHVVRGAPSIRELANLELGQYAWRKDSEHIWQLGQLE
jgi:hypothetical protein